MKAALARWVYGLAWYLGLPLVAGYLLWRSLRQRAYRQHWAERFLGRGRKPADSSVRLWLHAVSVGETHAATPLIELLLGQRADMSIVLTHMTPTGRAVGEALAQRHPGRIVVRYLPYELGWAIRRFFNEVRPNLGVLMETEVWPQLLTHARARALPMLLINARLSEKSAVRAQRFRTLIEPAARAFVRVLAQSDADRQRLAQFYAGPIDVLGNLKFDLRPDAAWVAQGQALRSPLPSLLLASSRDGEEAMLLEALAQGHGLSDRQVCVWVVPRHPQRFDEVEQLLINAGHEPLRRSAIKKKLGSDQHFILGDTMGQMPLYYAAADVTLMGGSFGAYGAQNLIESCAVGTPVIVGPSTFNFDQVVRDAVAAGAALQVASMGEALALAYALLDDRARLARMRAEALRFAQDFRGATQRTQCILLAHLANASEQN
ncbi:MAG TPA: 3-deoxy-D-manno-octulosonic acid transferase [Burkholderiaceae bacterium]|nr:3-deoxy-D-manno-octulosonic acid transferase [Burkholderiaceae bacterium]